MKLEDMKRYEIGSDCAAGYGNCAYTEESSSGAWISFEDVEKLDEAHKAREKELADALKYAKAWLESFDGIQMSLRMNNQEVKKAFEKINLALGIKP